TGRRLPIAAPLKPILMRAFMLHGRPERGRVLGDVSVTSGRLMPRAAKAWSTAAAKQRDGELGLDPIGLHECRHTYASFLMAAGRQAARAQGFQGPRLVAAHGGFREVAPPAGRTRRRRRPPQRLSGGSCGDLNVQTMCKQLSGPERVVAVRSGSRLRAAGPV